MKNSMKKLAMLVMLCIAIPAFAQSAARPKPKDVVPLEAPPPPDIKGDATFDAKTAGKDIAKLDASPDTKVTVKNRGDERIEEYRFKGRHYKTKVTPAKGPAYYLIDTKGDGSFSRVDGPDIKMNVPMWILLEW
jgi:opacity protein-like surface antigen